MALISYAEKHPRSAYLGRIRTDLSDTYGNVCGETPAARTRPGPTHSSSTPTATSTTTTSAGGAGVVQRLQVDAQQGCLYLAEQLWSYVTAHGWRNGCNGGVIQDTKAKATKDAFANALYLRNSAWLYSITGETRFMTGAEREGRRGRGCQVRPGPA